MSQQTAKSFLSLLEKSELVPREELKPILSQLGRDAGGKTVTLNQLVKHLIDSGVITQWQCEKLQAGKSRGYFLGKYKLLQHLGTGGMSTVYLAEHRISKQARAIKVLPKRHLGDKSYLDRFYLEGRAAASLNHPNIVRVYDIDHDGQTHYLVLEYVAGEDLYERVKASGPLDFDKVVRYTSQAAIGLHHAHTNNLVHRDIKPANLLVTADDQLKILDLGLALMREAEVSLTLMHDEKVLGTADYLAPEQAINSHEVDHRADIYSLGCSVYFLITGKPPFHEGSIAQRIAMHQSRDPEGITEFRPDCPPELVAICDKMLQKKPADRFQSCDELVTALKTLEPAKKSAVRRDSLSSENGETTRKTSRQSESQTSAPAKSPMIAASTPTEATGQQSSPRKSADEKTQTAKKTTSATVSRQPGGQQPKRHATAKAHGSDSPQPGEKRPEVKPQAAAAKQRPKKTTSDPPRPRTPANAAKSGTESSATPTNPAAPPERMEFDDSRVMKSGIDFSGIGEVSPAETPHLQRRRQSHKSSVIMIGFITLLMVLLGVMIAVAMWLTRDSSAGGRHFDIVGAATAKIANSASIKYNW